MTPHCPNNNLNIRSCHGSIRWQWYEYTYSTVQYLGTTYLSKPSCSLHAFACKKPQLRMRTQVLHFRSWNEMREKYIKNNKFSLVYF